MTFTRKALAACLAAAAISVAGVASASAETGGHFTSTVEHTTFVGIESGSHSTQFLLNGSSAVICAQASYVGTAIVKTTTEIAVTPQYANCKTEASSSVPIHVNGCHYVLTIGNKPAGDNTFHLICPAGKTLELTHPSCTMRIPAQTPTGGVSYTPGIENGKGNVTADLTLNFTVHYEAGICIFLGTSHTLSWNGSLTFHGENTVNEPVGIDATGSGVTQIRFESSHPLVTGEQTGPSKMTFSGPVESVECSTASLDGTASASAVSELTLKVAYGGCVGAKLNVTSHMNGCTLVLGVTGSGNDGSVAIECPEGQQIETTVDKFSGGCTLTIGPQSAGGVVDYKEEGFGTGRDLLLTWTIGGLKYKRDGCEASVEGTNGTMSGSITLSGEDTSGNPKGIWIE